jgi:hypothetical protein
MRPNFDDDAPCFRGHVPASPKKERQKEIIAKWEWKQLELERRIQNLTITEGDVRKFNTWWQMIRD